MKTHTMTRAAAYDFLPNDAVTHGWFKQPEVPCGLMTYAQFCSFIDEVEGQRNHPGQAAEQAGTADEPFFGYVPDRTRSRWCGRMFRTFYAA